MVDIGQHAVGVIAIGQDATGVIALGQSATGVIAIGQIARGGIAVGMAAIGVFAIGMGAAGVAWSSGMLAVGGRTGFGMLELPLVPRIPRQLTTMWGVLSVVQLAVLIVLCVVFWRFVGVPLGDALFGPGGIVPTWRASAP